MSSSSGGEFSWISWFCSLRGHEFFCEVDEDYMFDRFNLTGLSEIVPNYAEALEFIMEPPSDDPTNDQMYHSTTMLYGLTHARYILTTRGLQQMLDKFTQAEFGVCNLYYCDCQPLLPLGLSDTFSVSMVKLYCPRCQNLFNTRSQKYMHVDGAYFGTTFAHLLLLTFPTCRPPQFKNLYVPKIYGFKIHKKALETLGDRDQSKDRRSAQRSRQ